METGGKVSTTRADRAFLKIGMAAIGIPVIVLGAYAILVTAFDRHPRAPFVEPDRVVALEVLSSVCGISGLSFSILPASFEVQEKRIRWACETKVKRTSEQ